MSALSEIVAVTITAETAFPTRAGFGTPLVAGYHTAWAGNRVREFSDIAGLTAAGIPATHPISRAASKIIGQNPRPTTFKVGRRDLVHTQSLKFTPTSIAVGLVYTMTFTRFDGTAATATYTVQVADTIALIIDGLLLAIAAISPALDMTPTDNTTDFDLVATTPGQLFDVSAISKEIDVADFTPDPGVATDLAAIRVDDPDWYGLVLDSNGELEVLAAAAWAQAEVVLFGTNSADADILADTAGNLFELLDGFAYSRTFALWSGSILSYAGAGWMGERLPSDPGASTWHLKTIAGLAVDVLTTTQRANIKSNKGNHYTRVAGLNVTQNGITFSGQFIDITRFVDFLGARIQENVFAIMANLPKVPYTDSGVDLILAEITAELNRNIPAAIAQTPEPTVTAPKVATVSAVDRGNRLMPDIKFGGTLSGAIHNTQIAGTLTV